MINTRRLEKTVGAYKVDYTTFLGKGSFAVVYAGQHLATEQQAAIKVVNTASLSPKALQRLDMEIAIMKKLQHPNIVQCYDARKVMITEHCFTPPIHATFCVCVLTSRL
jgi:serine/threonine-protein kinase ULK2